MIDWFECNSLSFVKMAKYWASEEMAKEITLELYNINLISGCDYETTLPYLKQLLKKEWFR